MAMTISFCALPLRWRSFLAHDRRLPPPRQLPSISPNQGEDAMNRIHAQLNRRHLLAGAGATATTLAAPAIGRAQSGPLKVGVLLPRSGFEAGIGQDCQRGVDIAAGILTSLALSDLTIMNGDTESNVDPAREHAEKLISDGAQLLVGAFDSGQSTAIAQVAEQKGIPLVITI